MPFKSHAVKEQALLGAKEYRARVEENPDRYCGDAWFREELAQSYRNALRRLENTTYFNGLPSDTRREDRLAIMRETFTFAACEAQAGCIMMEALCAVQNTFTVVELNDMGSTVRRVLGLHEEETTPVIEAHDRGGHDLGAPAIRTQADLEKAMHLSQINRVNRAYEKLAAIPVATEEESCHE